MPVIDHHVHPSTVQGPSHRYGEAHDAMVRQEGR